MAFFCSACAPAARQAGYSVEHPQGSADATNVDNSQLKLNQPSSDDAAPSDGRTPALAVAVASDPPLPPPAPLPEGGQPIGRPGGIALAAFSPSAHWVAYCQAPESQNSAAEDSPAADIKQNARGEPMADVAVFFWTSDGAAAGKSEAIEALLRYDSSGRYVVLQKDSAAWLIDTVRDERWDLSALKPDLRADHLPAHRSFAFSDTHLVLLSSREKASDGSRGFAIPLPHTIDPVVMAEGFSLTSLAIPVRFGLRQAYRLQDGVGQVSALTLPVDATEKSWPVPVSPRPIHACHTPTSPYAAFGRLSSFRPDPALEVAWLPLPVGKRNVSELNAELAPGFVMGRGDSWVRRLESGRLMLVRNKVQKQITSENCGSRILQGYGPHELFLVACEEYAPVEVRASKKKTKPKFRFDLYLVRPGFVRSLKADVMRTGVDVLGEPVERYLPIRPGSSAALVDFKRSRLLEIEGDARVISIGSAGVLVRRQQKLSLWTDADTSEQAIDFSFQALDPVLVRGPTAAIGSEMFSLTGQLQHWSLPRAPLAISNNGYALLVSEPTADGRWPRGPLVLLGPEQENSPQAETQPLALAHPLPELLP